MQVLGHTKTVLVLLTSWFVFHEHMSGRKLLGMALAVIGMMAYGYYSSSQGVVATKKQHAETLPLFDKGQAYVKADTPDLKRLSPTIKVEAIDSRML